MKITNDGERIMFASNPLDQLFPMFAQGKFSEVELYAYGSEHDWTDEIPSPPGVGLWVWEYTPSGGNYQSYNGEYDAVDMDNGTWRQLTFREWYFVQQGENPWVPVEEGERIDNLKEDFEYNVKTTEDALDVNLESLIT